MAENGGRGSDLDEEVDEAVEVIDIAGSEHESGSGGDESDEWESGGSDSDGEYSNETDDEDDGPRPGAVVDTDSWTVVDGSRRIQVDGFEPGGLPPGPNHNLSPDALPLEYLGLFFNEDWYKELVVQTNSYTAVVRELAAQAGTPHRTSWTKTSVPEMKAWLAMNIRFGLKGSAAINDTWSTRPSVRDE